MVGQKVWKRAGWRVGQTERESVEKSVGSLAEQWVVTTVESSAVHWVGWSALLWAAKSADEMVVSLAVSLAEYSAEMWAGNSAEH